MRHGKSDWDNNLSDFERPLNQRGEKDVIRMGRYLKKVNINPDIIVSSASVRTTSTAELLQNTQGFENVERVPYEELYLAHLKNILHILHEYMEKNYNCVMLVGHNPGLDDAVMYLAQHPPERTLTGKLMTTAAVAVFDITTGLGPNQCQLQQLLRPKEIKT